MKINQWKTNVLMCRRQQIYPNIVLNCIRLETVYSIIYFGSKISSDEKSWSNIHITKINITSKKNNI